jgi:hypothetical protein
MPDSQQKLGTENKYSQAGFGQVAVECRQGLGQLSEFVIICSSSLFQVTRILWHQPHRGGDFQQLTEILIRSPRC